MKVDGIIPQDFDSTIELSKKDIDDKFQIITSDKHPVIFNINNNTFNVSASHEGKEFNEDIDCVQIFIMII